MKCYSSCEDLPLYNFIKIVVHKDYSFLLKNPKKKNKKDLVPLWQTIFEEYLGLTESVSTKQLFEILKDIYSIELKLKVIYATVDYLTGDYSSELVDMLYSMGFTGEFKGDTLEADLKRVISSAKRMIIKMKEAEAEYKNLDHDNTEPTEKDFTSILVHLSKFVGFKLSSREITVLEFVSFMDEYKNYSKPVGAPENE